MICDQNKNSPAIEVITTYWKCNFGKFFADGLFEDGPEVDAERRSWRNRLASACLSYDTEAPLLRPLMLLRRL